MVSLRLLSGEPSPVSGVEDAGHAPVDPFVGVAVLIEETGRFFVAVVCCPDRHSHAVLVDAKPEGRRWPFEVAGCIPEAVQGPVKGDGEPVVRMEAAVTL